VIVSFWEGTAAEAEPHLTDYNFITIAPRIKVYLKKDSPNIHWETLQ
jgi:hypothetical protein